MTNVPGMAVNDLVSIGSRLRWTWLCRAALGPAAGALAWAFAAGHGAVSLLTSWGAWTALTLVLMLIGRDRRAASGVLNLSLLGDGVLLAYTWHLLGGLTGYGTFLVILHIIGVTLLASFRTGAKLTMWHGLLGVFVVQSQSVGLLEPRTPVPVAQVWLYLTELVCTALVTASFAAVNERELRRRRYDDHLLKEMAASFMIDNDPVRIARRLSDLACDELLFRRSAVLVEDASGGIELTRCWSVVSTDQVSAHQHPAGIARNSLITRAQNAALTTLVQQIPADTDPDLVELLPDAHNVICVPFNAQQVKGALLLEHGRGSAWRRSSRVHRRLLATVEHAASLTAMSLSRSVLVRRLQDAARTDGLTGIANRRTFDTELVRVLTEGAQAQTVTSLALVDLDHFKRINDELGHQAGDNVLRATGAVLRHVARNSDVVARYGGEEFGVILPDTTAEEAMTLAERLRATIAAMTGPVEVTASVGVAAVAPGTGTVAELIRRADTALYAAKSSGRNRVVVAPLDLALPEHFEEHAAS